MITQDVAQRSAVAAAGAAQSLQGTQTSGKIFHFVYDVTVKL